MPFLSTSVDLPFLSHLYRTSLVLLQQPSAGAHLAAHALILSLTALLEHSSSRDVILSTSTTLAHPLNLIQKRTYGGSDVGIWPSRDAKQSRDMASYLMEVCVLLLSCCRRGGVPADTHLAACQLLCHVVCHVRRNGRGAAGVGKKGGLIMWDMVWEGAIASIKFISTAELLPLFPFLCLSDHVLIGQPHATLTTHETIARGQSLEYLLRVMNIAITCGDDLMHSAASYDQLVYELMRSRETFDQCEAFSTCWLFCVIL